MIKIICKFLLCQIARLKNRGLCRIHPSCIILGNNYFEGLNKIANHSYINNVRMGYASYIGANCEFKNAVIGRYSSIGNNVTIVTGTHPIENAISTHPLFYTSDTHSGSYVKNTHFSEVLRDKNGYSANIGNDVWIGDSVLIKGGLSIGDGSIIAMGAVVTSDVAPYSIVGGVPAKIIRYRFDDATIDKLNELKWWNKDKKWIEEHAIEFSDAKAFLKKI